MFGSSLSILKSLKTTLKERAQFFPAAQTRRPFPQYFVLMTLQDKVVKGRLVDQA